MFILRECVCNKAPYSVAYFSFSFTPTSFVRSEFGYFAVRQSARESMGRGRDDPRGATKEAGESIFSSPHFLLQFVCFAPFHFLYPNKMKPLIKRPFAEIREQTP